MGQNQFDTFDFLLLPKTVSERKMWTYKSWQAVFALICDLLRREMRPGVLKCQTDFLGF